MKLVLKLEWCSYAAARYAVEHWHYSRRMPQGKRTKIGVWEAGEFVGTIIFARSVTPHLGRRFGLSPIECVELSRIALNHHAAPVTRMVAIALRMLHRRNPGIRMVVSYADPNEGHVGGIYQAGNWLYLGESSAIVQYYFRGQWRNDTNLFHLFARRPELRALSKSRKLLPKHKYALGFDAATQNTLRAMAKPYPKRAGSVASDTPANHAGEGGATPTPALT